MIIVSSNTSANRMSIGLEFIEYRNEMYSSGCVFCGIVDGYMRRIMIIIGRRATKVIFMVREGIGIFGEIATKYENKTNMPLI